MAENSTALKITLLFVATLTIMAGTTVAPSLPAIEQSFLSTPHVGLLSRMVLTLPSVFVALCAPVAGMLADRFGRKRLLLGAILLYSLSGMSGLFADSLAGLLVGRAFLGLAIGGIMTIGTALVGDYFESPARERYLGLQQAFTQLGGVLFVVAGGLLADIHWRAPFAVYAVALLILPAALLFLREPERGDGRARDGGPAGAVNWPVVAVLALTVFLVNALFYTIPSQLPFFLRELGVFSGSIAGYAIGIFNLAGALTALNFARLRRHMGVAIILAVGLMLMATGFALLAMAKGLASMLSAVAVTGLGLGVVMPAIMSTTIMLAPLRLRGRIAGIVTASMFLGHFISPLASQPWIARFGFAMAYRDIALIFTLMAVLAAMAAIFQRRAVMRKARSFARSG
ncbi:Tetracycline resistance protein, class C [Rhizobium rhizogenes]|uniref:Tetracycline resistance protein, class C n=1 Tax=Rhizobium rhizogenes TaxID=359 RepID=A0AAN2DDJ7_RHIRH|nr:MULTISPECIES: MFS transporter [Rhizobium/Agrobacterium group]AQS61027.1 MFS transporter [Rhizobium rhizogenes]MCZ7445386.1 MFS transporter [Rhizobium rhizogenes]NSZ79824.1 MFS transporter [Agrobacterium tumefaciens]OAM63943.1 MFS transporter [Rhizobium rhizogenes]CAD0212825.1 Tetracycline resistance protein, class C [Rhizobium rhizogenes]